MDFDAGSGIAASAWPGPELDEASVELRRYLKEQMRSRSPKTGATPRVIPLDDRPSGTCLVCGKPSAATVFYARAY